MIDVSKDLNAGTDADNNNNGKNIMRVCVEPLEVLVVGKPAMTLGELEAPAGLESVPQELAEEHCEPHATEAEAMKAAGGRPQ